MKLPDEFLTKMQEILNKDEYKAFLMSYNMPRYYGLRVNTLKISVERFMEISPFKLERIPWTKDGFYYNEGENPGKHPFYYAGLYYIQEPSAMLPATVLDAKPGEYILDLCAAPGGKTVQIAAGMKGEGLLMANDTSAERLKALVKNIELCGVRNAIVTNEQPQKLAAKFPGYFDKILVDAPCSGEGMFRKDENAIKSWGKYKCDNCAVIQKDILEYADVMLKPGGRLVYSTCTFSPEEDEMIIGNFLKKHNDYDVLKIPLTAGIERGKPEWGGGDVRLAGTVRLWPHKVKGEGHFTAVLEKTAAFDGHINDKQTQNQEDNFSDNSFSKNIYIKDINYSRNINHSKDINSGIDTLPKEYAGYFKEFMKDNLNIEIDGNFMLIGNNLYYFPVPLPDLSGIKVVKFGWYLGEFINVQALGRPVSNEQTTIKKQSPHKQNANKQKSKEQYLRGQYSKEQNLMNQISKNLVLKRRELEGQFEPSHPLLISLKMDDVKNTSNFTADSSEILKYLKGETLITDGQKGLTAVCVDGFTIGWAKQTGGMLKNLYPKGWRKHR
ncbi:MAG TPA: RsmB/NOP family class I SAM-dependent RNA methyltransferase [Clostridiales bacterium]|mgnify:CR=1 FL=1|nr:RsmB/NOP family class I SAM-dependent RNA methyltransferase [Clostridiales bacterium]